MFQRLFSRQPNANQAIADALYARIVAAARQPPLYSEWMVPDTPLGRFEMMSLHMLLLQHRLRGEPAPAGDVAQLLIDDFFTEVDHSLRELGIGDMGVPKRMKKLARMFYGRTASYSEALDSGDHAAMAAALARNVRPDAAEWPQAQRLAAYVFDAQARLRGQPGADIVAGRVEFPQAGPKGAAEPPEATG